MARTGSAIAVLLVAGSALGAELEFYMTVDRNKVGTEDTFRCEIVVSNAPEGAVVQFPAPNDFEMLSRSESTQMSYSVGAGGMAQIKQVRKFTLIFRANRAGTLTIPPAGLQTANRTYKTDPVTLEVVPGRLAPDPRSRPRQQPVNPFGLPPGFPFDDDTLPQLDDPFGDDPGVPTSDSDIFLRATLDRPEVFVGEQVTLTLQIYSRKDLMGVDSVTMPKLDGFLSHDIATPSNLQAEERTVGGIRYRAYLLRSKALFALKPGDFTIEPAGADIVSGVYPFSQRKLHRASSPLALKVKPVPPGVGNVGRWRLSTTTNQTDLALGEPIQLKVVLEGRGNVKAVNLPALEAPASFRVFDPQTSEKTSVTKGLVGGQRTVEYVLVPQQTGSFVLPGLKLEFFNPDSQQTETTETDAISITVRPSATGAAAIAAPTNATPDPLAKNQLVGGGTRPLRHTATFSQTPEPLWSRDWSPLAALAPLALTVVLGVGGLVRSRLGQEDEASRRNKQARAARQRLAQAEKLSSSGSTTEFYAEVDKALRSFLEARLSQNVTGLTREQLDAVMQTATIPEPVRQRVLAVFETCDVGRYAPGMGDGSARRRALDDAAHAMEAWP